jgi:hypothetical protein
MMGSNNPDSSANIELLRRTLKCLIRYNLEWDDESARELQREVQEAVDYADGKHFSCETCGKDIDNPSVTCDECLYEM